MLGKRNEMRKKTKKKEKKKTICRMSGKKTKVGKN